MILGVIPISFPELIPISSPQAYDVFLSFLSNVGDSVIDTLICLLLQPITIWTILCQF